MPFSRTSAERRRRISASIATRIGTRIGTCIATRVTRPFALGFTLALAAASALHPQSSHAADRYLRPNLLGYRGSDPKVARLLSKTNRAGATVQLIRASDQVVVWTGAVPASQGTWGTFGFVHPIDFSAYV